MKEKLKKQLSEDKKVIDSLLDDINQCEEKIKDNDSQFYRRSFIRTFFSLTEAITFMFRRHAMYSVELDIQCKASNALRNDANKEIHKKKWFESSKLLHEWSLLSHEFYAPGETGKLKRQERKIPFINYVAFSIRAYSQHSRWFDCSTFFADNGWNDFKKSAKIRNRITHPKSEEDILISEEDMKIVESASVWFQCVIRELGKRFKMTSEGKKPDLNRARKEIAEQGSAVDQSHSGLIENS